MFVRHRLLWFAAGLGFVPGVLGAQRPATDSVVWPPPPEAARIRYVGFLHSEMDVGRRLSFLARVRRAVVGTRPALIALRRPHDVYADSPSRFYMTDAARGRLVVFDADRREARILGNGGPGLLRKPLGVGGDGHGQVYVADAAARRVVVFGPAGEFVRAYGGEAVLVNPVDVAVDAARDRIYVADSYLHQIVVFGRDGSVAGRIGKSVAEAAERRAAGGRRPGESSDLVENRGGAPGEFRFPTSVAVAPDGTLYVSDALNFRVQAFDPEGRFLREFGRLGDTPGSFARPKGVAVSADGHVYVADAAFNNVQVFDREGQLLLAFGNLGHGSGEFWLPQGIHVDRQNRVYVADKFNNRVQVFERLNPTERIQRHAAGEAPRRQRGQGTAP